MGILYGRQKTWFPQGQWGSELAETWTQVFPLHSSVLSCISGFHTNSNCVPMTFGRQLKDLKCQPVPCSPNHKNNPWGKWHPLSCCCLAVSCLETASSVIQLPCQGFFMRKTEISNWPLPKLAGLKIKGGGDLF